MPKPCTGLRVAAFMAAAALLALLIAPLLTAAGHRCIFDELQRSQLAAGASAVVETEDRGAPRRQGAELHEDIATSVSWEPIRITVFTEDLDNDSRYCTQTGSLRPDFMGSTCVCEADDILTDEKKCLLRDVVIHDAVQMHRDRLLVQRHDGNIRVDRFTRGICSHFTVPESSWFQVIVINCSSYLSNIFFSRFGGTLIICVFLFYDLLCPF
ncbi:unnamed protein product [Phytomonas sp. EM1]|nr:unnamed protein product [Phytomonas sp. EM1]|eukprot:CCW61442.1 unnamed protein product [Phytomonas sp. isolate EM1]